MSEIVPDRMRRRIDVCSLEADMAFFEARLSFARENPDTVYQQAQIKTYKTLNRLLGEALTKLKPPSKSGQDKGSSAAA